jgi:voltage-gated potassium channel
VVGGVNPDYRGYGDVYPITAVGKLLSSVFAILGVGLVALPSGIVCSGMINEINLDEQKRAANEKGEQEILCPHCGKPIHFGIAPNKENQ